MQISGKTFVYLTIFMRLIAVWDAIKRAKDSGVLAQWSARKESGIAPQEAVYGGGSKAMILTRL